MNKEFRSAAIVKLVVWSVVAVVLMALLAGAIVGDSFEIISFDGVISFGGYVYDDAESYGVGNAEYSENVQIIDISWLSGNINVVTWDGSTVKVEEVGDVDNDGEKMRSRVQNGRLSVKFAESGLRFTTKSDLQKTLTVYIPESMVSNVKKLRISAASANATVDGGENQFAFEEVDVDSASSVINVKCLSASRVDVDTASGDVYLSGSFGNVEIDAASADVELKGSVDKLNVDSLSGHVKVDGELSRGEIGTMSGEVEIKTYTKAPTALEIETVSGGLELIIPKTESGFVARFDSLSGEMVCNGVKGDYYQSGSGVAIYEFESLSSRVTITEE